MSEFEGLDRFRIGELTERLPEEFEEAYEIGLRFRLPSWFDRFKPKALIFAGVGGSAVGGDLIRGWLRRRIDLPMEVCRGYEPPAYASEETLVFTVSYSGNTEETLNFMVKAHKIGCPVVSLSSGGVMEKASKKLGVPHIKVPSGLLPRAAIAYLSAPIIPVLERLVDKVSKLRWEVEEALESLRNLRAKLSRSTSERKNPAKRLARRLHSKIPVVFGYGHTSPVARRFKNQLNENSKVAARWDEFPELDHNEVMAYQAPISQVKDQLIVILRSRVESAEITARIEATRKLMEEAVSGIQEVWGSGSSVLANMLTLLYITDMASVYLAYLRGVDPGDTSLIEGLKK
ncbi:MAG TPA: bifunctional phosphoglucose/phosphomannose isomerase, partial [Armatimonadetes bacterium]|nr:bifunctional phosphoglucose/phosphomannose isomerase [Armatimonadota bacterium]